MERRVLVAKRRGSQYQIANRNKGNCSLQNNFKLNPDVRSTSGSSHPSKNIACARMIRLRESLAKDLKSKNSISDTPPAKRFASNVPRTQYSRTPPTPQNANISINLEQRSPKFKSPRKTSTPYSNSHARESANKRLKAAVTSTPEHQRVSSSLSSPDVNLNSSCIQTCNTASTSGIELLNDDDVNITDVSHNSSDYLCASSTSNISLLCNPNVSEREDLEDMDWSPVNEERLLSDLREARETMYLCNQPPTFRPNTRMIESQLSVENIYIIVDTNIFIDKLQTIINIMHIYYADDSQPVIYVPWMVIQELDYFKDGYSLSEKHPVSKLIQTRCRKAVKFINDCLMAHKPNFKGQPVQRAAESRLKGTSADDSILSCCVQLFSEGYDVVLLSSDTNLRNKAMISNIRAFSPCEIIKELGKKPRKININFVDEVSKKLSLICSFILHFEIKAHYGEHEYEKKSFKDLPWNFKDCVKYLAEHFDPVFRQHVPKQCRKVVDDLHELVFVNDEIVNEFKFRELGLSLLIYLQTGLPKYDDNIQNTIQEINQLEKDFFT